MSVKLLNADAKQLLARRMSEWRDLESLYGFEIRGKVMNSAEQEFIIKLREEVDKKMVEYWNILQKTNDKPIPFGDSSDAMKEIFKKEIKGVVILCCNAFFEVRGLYSEEEAKLLVQEKIRKDKSEIDYIKFRKDTPEDQLGYERLRIPENVLNEVWRRDQGKCVQCSSVRNLEFDHLIPMSKGGSNTTRNLQLLCETCNRRKSASIG
jgi:HNH endonuclease